VGSLISKADVLLGDVKIKETSHTSKKSMADINIKSLLFSEQMWFCFFGLIFGMASINGLYPFGLAYMASTTAVYRNRIISVGFFAFLGILVSVRNAVAFRYLISMAIFIIAFTALAKGRRKEWLPGFLLFASNMAAGMIYLAVVGYTLYDLLLLTMESCIAAILIYIIPSGLSWLFKVSVGEAERTICLAVIAGVVLSITGGVKFFGISLKNILSVLAVQLAAFAGGAGSGASAGIIIGITGFLLPLAPWSVAVMAFSGLVAGTFEKFGKAGVAGGFALGYVIYNLYVNSMGERLITIPVLVISTALFLMVPSRFLQWIKEYMEKGAYPIEKSYTAEIARDRLCEIAVTLEEMGQVFTDVEEEKEPALHEQFLDSFCRETQESVCRECGLYRICWEKDEEQTVRSLYTLLKNYKAGYRDILPLLFKKRCDRYEDIKKIAENQISVYNLKRHINNIVKQQQLVLGQKFNNAGRLIANLAMGIPSENSDVVLDKKLADRFKQAGIQMDHVWSLTDDDKVEVYMSKEACEGEKLCERKIPAELSDFYGTKFYVNSLSCPLRGGNSQCRMKAISTGNLGIAVGVAAAAKEGCETSGDGFAFSELNDGKFMLALSDGMGVGEKAAAQSEKTLDLLERFLNMGFEDKTVLNIVNSYLVLQAKEESFSTIDLALVDTHSGRTRFLKAGSAPGFIKRGRKVEIIKGGSLPVGIMDSVSPTVIDKDLKAGDIVILVTDGVIDGFTGRKSGEEALSEFIASLKTSNPQEIADEILKKARENSARDDMTVMAARIWEKLS